MIQRCGDGSERRVRETRNKNKEDRNVSKFVVSSAMGLNACGIYANDSIFKPYVRSFVPYLFHPIPGRNREEEKLLENNCSVKNRGMGRLESCVFSRNTTNTMNPSPSIELRFFSTLRNPSKTRLSKNHPTFQASCRLSDFQQIKFNERHLVERLSAARVYRLSFPENSDLNRSDFAPHLSTSFCRWLATNDWQEHLSPPMDREWPHAVLSTSLSLSSATMLDAEKLIRLRPDAR